MTTLEESLGDKDVKQYAVQRLAKLLRHPDDLIYKADDVRRKLAQEKFLIDAQLNTDVRRQFDDVQEGLELLYSTKEQITRVKTDMQKVDQLCHDAQSYLTNFDRIQKISMVNRNFVRTDEFYRQFSEFHEQYTSVRHMLTDAQTNFDQADFNLLRLHYSLYKLEDFRNRAMGFSGASDADSQQTLSQMFGSLDALVAEFEEFLWHVASNMFELALRNRTNIIVQLLKVIEVEEAADRLQEKEREGAGLARRQSLLGNAKVLAQAHAPKTDRKVKHYKQKLLGLIHKFVSERINEFFEQEVQDFEGISEVTGFVVDELTFVSDAVAPGFPVNYYIFDVYVEEYHQAVVANTNRLAGGELDGGAILVLLRWVREYGSAMRRDLGIPREQLKPALLEGREDQLVQEYLDLVRSKVREWVVNLMRSETSTFVNRQDAPHISDAGTYVLEGSVILFEIINQQITLVVESQRAKLLCDLMAECNRIFQDMSKQWKDVIGAEKQKQIKDENVIEGLVDYAMALGNDSLRCVEQAETIREEIGSTLGRAHQERFRSELSQTMDIFMDIAEAATGALADIIFNDLQSVTTAFYTADWYHEDMVQLVIETFVDYDVDLRDRMDPYLYERLMQDLLSRLALAYVDAVSFKVRFYKTRTTERLKHETAQLAKYFRTRIDPEAVTRTLDIVNVVLSMIESAPAMFFLEFFSFKKQYPDLPLALVEDILSKRDDLDKAQMRSIVESLRQKTKGDTGSSLAKQRTLFSKLTHYSPLGGAQKSSSYL